MENPIRVYMCRYCGKIIKTGRDQSLRVFYWALTGKTWGDTAEKDEDPRTQALTAIVKAKALLGNVIDLVHGNEFPKSTEEAMLSETEKLMEVAEGLMTTIAGAVPDSAAELLSGGDSV